MELDPQRINKISSRIDQAEVMTRWKEDKKGIPQPNPSSIRSELGAIDEIKPIIASDKRKFSVNEGLKWLSDPRTGGAYIIELFETPPPKQDWDLLTSEKYKLFKSFSDGLLKFGSGLIASRLVDSDQRAAMIGVKLEDSQAPASIQLVPVKSNAVRLNQIKTIVLDPVRHDKLLSFLEAHPLVKKIVLPPIISQSNDNSSTASNEGYSPPKLSNNTVYPKIGIVDGGVSSLFDEWVESRWGLLSKQDRDENHGTFIAGLGISGNSLNGSEICKELDAG